MNDSHLEVLFLWHLHQPHYGMAGESEYLLPWTRLHAVKAYYDMARHLEECPQIRGTFNFSGSLLQQLIQLSDQGWRDRWWRWCQLRPEEIDLPTRRELVRHFFSISFERGVAPQPRYVELYGRREELGVDGCAQTFEAQDFLDLQVLFNLAWCGHFAESDFPLVARLRQKGQQFTVDERDALLELHLEIVAKILPLYRNLADRDQIEITVSPMYHPIMPLVIDTESAAVATPNRPRPTPYRAPEYAADQLREARDLAQSIFGRRPSGIWPSEGSVSPAAYELFAEAGVDWIATDEEILRRSLGRHHFDRDQCMWRPWTLGEGQGPKIFFRDRWLSDQVGFVYTSNPPKSAARDLLSHLQGIRRSLPDSRGCVAIILDGENPWEHYEDSGYPFLKALYEGLTESVGLETSVFSEATAEPGQLPHLHSGSWIMGNYQIWIGHEETNSAWEWVRRAHELIDTKSEAGFDEQRLQKAKENLRIAQGSDWFWWYGGDFSSEQDAEFDALFRSFIIEIWELLGEESPRELSTPLYEHHLTADEEEARVIGPSRQISPTIDGQRGDDEGWDGAGQITLSGAHGSMFEAFRPLQEILFGFSPNALCLRLYPGQDFGPDFHFRLKFSNSEMEKQIHLELRPDTAPQQSNHATIAFDQLAELSLPLSALDAAPSQQLELTIEVYRADLLVHRFPLHHSFKLPTPPTSGAPNRT